MPSTTLIQTGLRTILGGAIIEILAEKAGNKAIDILKKHFSFSADEIANTFQTSYGYALGAISAGLAAPEQKLAFLQKLTKSKLSREFSDPIEQHYLRPFTTQRGLSDEALPALRAQLIKQINELKTWPPIFVGEKRPLTEAELAAVISHQQSLAITDLVLAQLQSVATLDETLAAFFGYQELLGNAILHFFVEQLRNEPRTQTTFAVLQREGLWADVREMKSAQETLVAQFQQQLDEQNAKAMQALKNGNFAAAAQITQQLQSLQQSIDQVPKRLQAAQAAWQRSHESLIAFAQRFERWASLLDEKVEQVLAAMDELGGQLGAVQADVQANLEKTAEVLDEVAELKQLLTQLLARFELSVQVKPQDEFTQHSSRSLALIQQALAKLKRLPMDKSQSHQLVMMAGSVASSTGDIAEAERLFIQARDSAPSRAEKALACFNLFQVRVRRKGYAEALAELQVAIGINPQRYALHNVEKYPIQQMLGAGGMGCVFLCQDQWRKHDVVVKCFWDGCQGPREVVFKEALIMRDLESPYVPLPLDYDYYEGRPYFVTEYIKGALDGEAWLATHGKLDLQTGLEVALQVAQGLAMAHQAGVSHLDLKPANLLFQISSQGKILVKMIDFGLARVATSLKQQAALTSVRSGKSLLVQSVFGTLDYAPPEQWGETQYGPPSAKSDVYAFGASLYRLLTLENPRFPHPSELPDVPELQVLLLDCLKPNPAKRPDIADVITRLSNLLEKIKKPVQLEKAELAKRQAEKQRQAQQKAQQAELAKRQAEKQRQAQQKAQQAELAKRQAEEQRQAQQQARQAELAKRQAEEARQAEQARKRNERKPGTVFRDRLKDDSEGPEMIWLPAGRFRMGDIQGTGYTDEQPVHEVSVEGFAMGRYPITVGEFRQFVEATGYKTTAEKKDGSYVWKDNDWKNVKDANWRNPYFPQQDNQPVVCISWYDAVAYAEWLTEQTGQQYRLPTEAESEYANRAGTETDYWWGNDIGNNRANCYDSGSQWSGKQTSPVGSFEPNPFGLYDTVGNVWEWTCSAYEDKYNGKEQQCVDKKNANSVGRFAARGASWVSEARRARSADRDGDSPSDRGGIDGVRLARIL
jgi:formylglycine-generating enzyme required for sulfatase activity